MTQYQYRELKYMCDDFGNDRFEFKYHKYLMREIEMDRAKKKVFRGIKKDVCKLLDFLVRVMRRFEE